jgi:hypothetical protein
LKDAEVKGERYKVKEDTSDKRENIMKTVSMLLSATLFLAGCAAQEELLLRAESPEQSNVYATVATALPPEKGHADLTIRASVKTHGPLASSLGSDPHGTSSYKLLMNIDGEPFLLSGTPTREDGSSTAGPHSEAGDGTRYLFRTHVRLKTGSHRVIAAFPDDEIAMEGEINLADATDNLLEIVPAYYSDRRQRGPGSAGATNFREGIRGLELLLNGKGI